MFFFMLIVVVFLGVISMEGICGGSGGATAYAKLAFLAAGLGHWGSWACISVAK
jgi:hypothetical protein